MFIREATAQDYSHIARLHAENWQHIYRGILGDDYLQQRVIDDHLAIWQTRLTHPCFTQGILVVEEDEQIRGFVSIYGNHIFKEGTCFEQGTLIDSLHIDLKYRGKGYGKALLAAAAKWAGKYFSDYGLYLEVAEGNKPAEQFYQALSGKNDGDVIWKTPCGTEVVCHKYIWTTPQQLLQAAN
ncbi:MAG: GNAT family N-acetyltransferase [Vibrio sp.]